MNRSTKIRFITTTRGFYAFLPCRAAVVPQDAELRVRDHPPPPELDRVVLAVWDARKAGHAYVVVDGTLIPIDRVAADRPFYSGKRRKHGMNLQVIATSTGDIVCVSGALPRSVHDKKAE